MATISNERRAAVEAASFEWCLVNSFGRHVVRCCSCRVPAFP